MTAINAAAFVTRLAAFIASPACLALIGTHHSAEHGKAAARLPALADALAAVLAADSVEGVKVAARYTCGLVGGIGWDTAFQAVCDIRRGEMAPAELAAAEAAGLTGRLLASHKAAVNAGPRGVASIAKIADYYADHVAA